LTLDVLKHSLAIYPALNPFDYVWNTRAATGSNPTYNVGFSITMFPSDFTSANVTADWAVTIEYHGEMSAPR